MRIVLFLLLCHVIVCSHEPSLTYMNRVHDSAGVSLYSNNVNHPKEQIPAKQKDRLKLQPA